MLLWIAWYSDLPSLPLFIKHISIWPSYKFMVGLHRVVVDPLMSLSYTKHRWNNNHCHHWLLWILLLTSMFVSGFAFPTVPTQYWKGHHFAFFSMYVKRKYVDTNVRNTHNTVCVGLRRHVCVCVVRVCILPCKYYLESLLALNLEKKVLCACTRMYDYTPLWTPSL